MAVLHAVFSMALVLGCAADIVSDSLLGGATELLGAGSGAWQGPPGFQCSDGVAITSPDWSDYLDETWVVFPATPEECWERVKEKLPTAQGFMYLNNPVCRVMDEFEVLAPDGVLAASYPEYQGRGGICIPYRSSTTTTSTTDAELGFLGAASRMHGACLIVLAAMIAMDVAAVVW